MEKFKVSFVANNQQLTATGTKHASDTYADIEATFALGERWTDMDSVSAVWWNDFTRIATVLDSEGKCTVPYEVLTRKGCVRVNLVGSVVEGGELVTRLTSYSAEAVHVNEKIKLTGNEPQTITPSQYEQFVENVKADADRAESAKESAQDASASAQGYAQTASASATSASESATLAEQAKQSAQASAQNAQISAQTAENAKDDAESARDEILGMRAEAVTLPEGSEATASYADGLLSLGIPRGNTGATGAKGDKGDTGATPNLTIGNVETLEPSESATATITGTAENPVLNLGIPQGDTGEVSLADLSTLLPTDTASGEIASFPDGQSVIPMVSLVADIEPIQDLNGYDKPWAGGAGKNKLQNLETTRTESGVTFTINTDGSVVVNGTATASIAFTLNGELQNYLTNGARYILNGSPINTDTSKWKLRVYNNGDQIDTGSGAEFIFNSASDARKCDIVVYNGTTMNNVKLYPMIRLASEIDATFEPYSNICPISGHAEVNAYVTGVNVWDEEWEEGAIANSSGQNSSLTDTVRSKGYIAIKPSTQYYAKTPTTVYIRFYDADKTYLGSSASIQNKPSSVFTTPSGSAYIRFYAPISGSVYNNDISINYPSTDTDYHAYQGDTYTTSLGQTVYGGKLDVVSGELTIDRAITDLGNWGWRKQNESGFHTFYTGTVWTLAKSSVPLCSNYIYSGTNNHASLSEGELCWFNTVDKQLTIRDTRYADAESFKTAMQGVQLVYELATPQTIQLTPQEIHALLGDNNVWADSGEVEVVYKADVTKWVEKKLNS